MSNIVNFDENYMHSKDLLDIKNIIKLVNLLIDKFDLKLESKELPRIYEQLVLLYLGISDSGIPKKINENISIDSNYYYAAISLVYSHIIDDFADIRKNNEEHRDSIKNLLTQSINTSEILSPIIELIKISSLSKESDSLEKLYTELSTSLKESPERNQEFAEATLKIILSGFIFTSLTEAEQKEWLVFYRNITKTENSLIIPIEILLSETASSLDLVSSFFNNISAEEINLWNKLYGPLIMLSNFEEELESGNVRIFGRKAEDKDYLDFLDFYFNQLMIYLKSNFNNNIKREQIGKRIDQFKIVVKTLTSDKSSHSFDKFPEDLREPLRMKYLNYLTELDNLTLQPAA